jgi:integrase
MDDMTKPRERANGSGTVWLSRDTRRKRPWAAVLVVGWTPEGKAIKRTRFASSRQGAERMLAEMRRAHAGGRPLPDDRLTVGKWLVRWLDHVRPTLRWATIRAYDQAIRSWLLPELGTLSLRTLAPSRVETMLQRMAGRGLSANTQASARDVLKRAIADAVKDGHVERNVAALARPPRRTGEQLAAPTTADVRALLAALDGHRLRDMVLVMAATGLRVSEAMGLRWEDIGYEGAGIIQPYLTVRYQLAWQDGEPVLAEPKSARSRRTILLPPVAVAALRSQRARQAAERLAAGDRWQDATGLVFLTATGRPMSESTLQWVMSRACKAAGIRHVRPHDLRRWTATAIVATGDVKAAQTVLGHVSASLTTDTYASPTDAGLRRAADAVGEALG